MTIERNDFKHAHRALVLTDKAGGRLRLTRLPARVELFVLRVDGPRGISLSDEDVEALIAALKWGDRNE